MPRSIMPMDLADSLSSHTVIDVRKAPAFLASGMTVAGACRRLPFDAENWWNEFAGRRVVVFCVHGHEVSRAVCGFLEDKGIDAAVLEGGFEAWSAAGLPVQPCGAAA